MKKEGKSFRKSPFINRKSLKTNPAPVKKPEKLICYNCRKSGHIQTECPETVRVRSSKLRGKKTRAMICIWSDESDDEEEDEDSTSEEEDKKSKLCLMAIGDEETETEVSSPFEDYSLSDWEDAYSELLDKYDDLKRDNKHLKKKLNQIVHDKTDKEKIINLENLITDLKNSLNDSEQDKICISDLRSENEKLLCEIDDIKIKMQKYLEESNISKEKFEAIKNINLELQNNSNKLQK